MGCHRHHSNEAAALERLKAEPSLSAMQGGKLALFSLENGFFCFSRSLQLADFLSHQLISS